MEIALEERREQSRLLGRVYGYVALGLLLTAFIALGVGAVVAKNLVTGDQEATLSKYGMLIVISAIALLVDTIVLRVTLRRNNHSGWIPFLIYSALFGIFLSTFVVIGLPFRLLGEAFLISSLVFGLLFLIGYFSPVNLNIIASIGLGLLFLVLLLGLFGIVLFLLVPGTFEIYDVFTCGLVGVVMLICIAADSYNTKRVLQNGIVTDNTLLSLATTLYTDFIYIFVRVVVILLKLFAKSKN